MPAVHILDVDVAARACSRTHVDERVADAAVLREAPIRMVFESALWELPVTRTLEATTRLPTKSKAISTQAPRQPRILVKAADKAWHAAKGTGRNRVQSAPDARAT